MVRFEPWSHDQEADVLITLENYLHILKIEVCPLVRDKENLILKIKFRVL